MGGEEGAGGGALRIGRVIVEAVDAEWRGDDEADLMAHCDNNSIGKGKIMVEFFSALMEFRVWR